MNALSPCPSCNRHVRAWETRCPFCNGALTDVARKEARPAARGRMSRAALFAAGAALAGAAACTDTNNNFAPPANDAGGRDATPGDGAAGQGGTGGHAGAGGAGGAGGASDAGTDAAHDGPVAIYSAAFPPLLGRV